LVFLAVLFDTVDAVLNGIGSRPPETVISTNLGKSQRLR